MKESLESITKTTLDLFKRKILTLPYFDGTHYAKNVTSLQMVVTKEGKIKNPIYSVFSNTILFPQTKIDVKALLHELIHMASSNRSTINQMSYRTGYEIVTSSMKCATALNEGLTQLIVTNSVDGDDTLNNAYPFETRLSKMLCYIFGEDVIYAHYFKADPESFINSIASLTGDKSIVNLILSMDKLMASIKSKEVMQFNETSGELLLEVQKVLVDMYLKMKEVNNLDDELFASMFINKNCDNLFISATLRDYNIDIEQYLKDRTK